VSLLLHKYTSKYNSIKQQIIILSFSIFSFWLNVCDGIRSHRRHLFHTKTWEATGTDCVWGVRIASCKGSTVKMCGWCSELDWIHCASWNLSGWLREAADNLHFHWNTTELLYTILEPCSMCISVAEKWSKNNLLLKPVQNWYQYITTYIERLLFVYSNYIRLYIRTAVTK